MVDAPSKLGVKEDEGGFEEFQFGKKGSTRRQFSYECK
jgi:hypothetical protein